MEVASAPAAGDEPQSWSARILQLVRERVSIETDDFAASSPDLRASPRAAIPECPPWRVVTSQSCGLEVAGVKEAPALMSLRAAS